MAADRRRLNRCGLAIGGAELPRVSPTALIGGGRIERAFALGRVDLAIFWPHPGGEQRIVIEVKVIYPGQDPAEKRADGLDQVEAYAARLPGADIHLMLFDRRDGISWEQRACDQVTQHRGQAVRVWGM